MSNHEAPPRDRPPLQFGLGALVAVVALFGVLFAALAGLGLTAEQALVAFGVPTATALAGAVLVELWRAVTGWRPRPWAQRRSWPDDTEVRHFIQSLEAQGRIRPTDQVDPPATRQAEPDVP